MLGTATEVAMSDGNYGFEQMVYEMPARLVEVDVLVREAGYGDEMVARLHNGGLRRVHIGDGRALPHLVNKAVRRLAEAVPEFARRTNGMVYAHSYPFLAPADVPFLAMCLDGLGLDLIPRIGVSGQPCAILHMAVQIAGYWLSQFPSGHGILLLGADQAYSAEERIFFGSAMGDVAVAMFMTRDAPRNRVLATLSQCEVIAYEGEASPEDDILRFRKLNPLYIRAAIEKCLQMGGIGLEDLTYIVPHTPYTMIWDTVSELLRFPRERILTDYLSETGHLNSNDSFVHYIRAVNEGLIRDGDLALLVNPAFGGTRGCTLIRR